MKSKKRSVKSVVKKVNKTLLAFRQQAAQFITDIGETRPTDTDYAYLYTLLKQVYQQGLRDGRKRPVQRKARRTRKESICTDDRCGF